MKKTSLLVAAALLLVSSATPGAFSQAADTVQSVVDKHIAALGGRDALMKITNRKAVGTVAISTPMGELTGPVELYSKAPTKSRAILSIDLAAVGGPGAMTIEQLFDGTTGWSINSLQGDQEITGMQLENMKNNHFPSGFLAADGGGKLELLPRETAGGKSWIVMKVTRPSGNSIKLYFDPATYLIARSVSSVENPAGGMLEQSSESQDYRTVDGVKVPFVLLNTNELQTITIKLTKVEHHVAMDDAMFKKK
jgi:hypothetical protein